MQKKRLRKGDIIEIPLPKGKKGFIQYVYPDKWGDIVGIYDYVTDIDDVSSIGELKSKQFKFFT